MPNKNLSGERVFKACGKEVLYTLIAVLFSGQDNLQKGGLNLQTEEIYTQTEAETSRI